MTKTEIRTDRTLYSKAQVDDLTKDYTPQMFLGDINNTYMGCLADLKYKAESNAPESLNIGGYTFRSLGSPFATIDQIGNRAAKYAVVLDYQATEVIFNEFPVLQVGIRVWRTKSGKVKSEIIRDGYSHQTRFW